MKRYYFLLMALLLLAACTKSETDTAAVQQLHNSPDFYASFEAEDTRTFVDEKVRLLWTEGDQLSIFTSTLNQKYEFDGKTGDNSGTFTPISSGQFGSGSSLSVDANYAVYPYNQSTKISYDGDLSIDLPSTQAYAEDSFGVNANTMVAATKSRNDYFLSFKNLGGFLKLQLYGDVTVKSIQLKGNNGEKIAGAATVVAKSGKNPTLTMSNTATDAITLDCGAGVKLGSSSSSATEFWIVVPPVTFTKGFTVTITDTEGGTMTKSTTKSYTVERNVMKSMTAFEVETELLIPTNEIWYTSTDGKIVIPDSSSFGYAKIVSNVYEGQKGIITFDREVSIIQHYAFYKERDFESTLQSIIIPNSITSIGESAFLRCTSLRSINIPNGVVSIETGAFSSCASLIDVIIPGDFVEIGKFAFNDCNSLRNVTIEGVAKIQPFAFAGCKSLENLTINGRITEVGERAFDACTTKKNIYISDLNAWFDIYFHNLMSNPMTFKAELYLNGVLVENLLVSNSIQIINNYAFQGCSSIKSVIIHNDVTEIGEYAFSSCKSLEDVYCKPTVPPALKKSPFSYNASDRKFYVPSKSVDAYKTADGWSDYADKIVGYDFE